MANLEAANHFLFMLREQHLEDNRAYASGFYQSLYEQYSADVPAVDPDDQDAVRAREMQIRTSMADEVVAGLKELGGVDVIDGEDSIRRLFTNFDAVDGAEEFGKDAERMRVIIHKALHEGVDGETPKFEAVNYEHLPRMGLTQEITGWIMNFKGDPNNDPFYRPYQGEVQKIEAAFGKMVGMTYPSIDKDGNDVAAISPGAAFDKWFEQNDAQKLFVFPEDEPEASDVKEAFKQQFLEAYAAHPSKDDVDVLASMMMEFADGRADIGLSTDGLANPRFAIIPVDAQGNIIANPYADWSAQDQAQFEVYIAKRMERIAEATQERAYELAGNISALEEKARDAREDSNANPSDDALRSKADEAEATLAERRPDMQVAADAMAAEAARRRDGLGDAQARADEEYDRIARGEEPTPLPEVVMGGAGDTEVVGGAYDDLIDGDFLRNVHELSTSLAYMYDNDLLMSEDMAQDIAPRAAGDLIDPHAAHLSNISYAAQFVAHAEAAMDVGRQVQFGGVEAGFGVGQVEPSQPGMSAQS